MKRLAIIMCSLFTLMSTSMLYGHSGGTDSKGGHRNHSTGEYHYHHGMGPHQHTKNGVCIPKRNRKILIGVLVVIGGGYLLTRNSK